MYYDGWCPLCQAIRHRLERLDRRGRLRFVSAREPETAALLGVDPGRLLERMHTRDPRSGRLDDGIDAVVAIARRLPALWPLLPPLWLSARLGFGRWVYDWIAARRLIVPVGNCEGGECSIHRGNRT